ncbi:hypothetical protein GMORB2_1889 [Geosmithia morbida]|uniref:Kinetochore protein fta4 n=1 Tax=Geosmithia morbida TaxID=1094350 RepID=A0A9P4YS20_9HYPO|nr:uncharacterized protein GMORB2_1889 [Geosmithia morbida]KAF4121482.1 hypothetical protein GMORB2_1889 [Geosmithia morbida]
MSSQPTITQLKERFITSQTLRLATPVTPSAAFVAANARSESALDPRQLDTVSSVLEGLIQDHCRRVFAPQANRALAEQISDSYSSEAERRLRGLDADADGISKEIDLVDQDAIDALPRTWLSDRAIDQHPEEAQRYAETVERLASLNHQRRDLRRRVDRLRRMRDTVAPLKTGEAGAGVQENIVTRNGQVEKELEKMRMLLVRVTGRVGGLPDSSGRGRDRDDDEDVKPLNEVRKRTIDDFLADARVFPHQRERGL